MHSSKLECDLLVPLRKDCVYTSCYCEENVWKLAHDIKTRHPQNLDQFFVVFISNCERTVPLWQQSARKEEDDPVIWDYHVILVHRGLSCVVYDLDTLLPFPTRFHKYVSETFQPTIQLKAQFAQYFKVVPAKRYLESFASDRSHMKKPDGTWHAEPPSYSCISTAASKMNLDEFIKMTASPSVGQVFDLMRFMQFFQDH